MSISLGSMDVGVAFVGDASGLQSATTQATAGVEKFGATSTKAMRQVAEDTAQANAAMQRLATGLKGAVVGGSLAVGLVKLKNSITEMSAAIIDAQVQLDKWNNGFKFGAGSMAAGTREMAFVREEAQRLGLELSGSATQYMKLVAASRGTTMEGEKTRSVFTAIAEAATVMGMSSEQSERAFMAITQMMSKGKVQAEELRGQLGEHLPGAFAIAARAMGVTEIELNKLMETGNVMSADFLPKFGAQLRKELAGSVEDASKSMQASLNRMATAWLSFKQSVAESGAGDFIAEKLDYTARGFQRINELRNEAKNAGGGFWAQDFASLRGIIELTNPLNILTGRTGELESSLARAQEKLVNLQGLSKTSPESPFFRVEIAQTQLLIKELQRAAQAKAMLDVAPGPTGSVASGDSALARANQADYEKRLAAYKGLMASMANPQEKFNAELVKQKALLGDLFTPDVEARLRAHYIKPTAQAREKTDEFAKALESLQEKATGLNTNYSETLATLYQGLNAGRFGQGEEGIANYRAAVESLIKLQPFFKDGLREEAEALKASQDAMAAKEKATAEYYDGLQKELGALSAKVEALQLEGQEIGLTDEALLALTLRRLDDAIATEQQALALASLHEASGEELVMMQRRIELLKEQRNLTANNGQQKLAAEAAKDAYDEWKKASDQIEQSLTDALMRGFESGKGFAEVLRDTVVNMFKTLVLRPVIQATVQGGLNAVGLGGPAGQGGFPNGAGYYSQFASSAVGEKLGLSYYNGTGQELTAFGENASQYVQAAGQVLGYASALNTAFSRNAQGGKDYGAAAGQAIGTYFGGPIGSFIGGEIGKALGLVDYSGTMHTGALASFSRTGGAATGDAVKAQGLNFGLSSNDYSQGTAAFVSGVAQSAAALLDVTATTFGKTAGAYVAAGFADDISPDGAWGALMIKMGDSLKVDWGQGADKWPGREFSNGETGAKEYAAAVALDVRNLLIEQTPDWADTMLTALGDAPTIEALAATVGQINAAASAMDSMGKASQAFAALGEDAAGALIAALGGAEAAVAGLSGYYSGFYSEAERTKLATDEVTAALAKIGVEMPTTRDAFRGIVDAAIAAGDTDLAAKLINISGAFAAVVPAAEAAATAVADTAAALATAAEDAAEKARRAALGQLEASAERERTLWEQQATAAASLRDEVQGIFSTLATSISELRAEALGPTLSAAQGQAFISQAIASAQAGAGLPAGADLASAISAARGGLGLENFTSSAEQQFATLKLAGELAVLQDSAGEQLSTAELQLRAAESQIEQLDETLIFWRKLIDGTEDSIDATLSVASAVDALRALMFPERSAAAAAAATVSGGVPVGTLGASFGAGTSGAAATSSSAAAATVLDPTRIRHGTPYERSLLPDSALASFGAGLGWAQSDALGRHRTELEDTLISEAIRYRDMGGMDMFSGYFKDRPSEYDSVASVLRAAGIPGFSQGINLVPYDMTARIHKGEAVVPAAFNPFNPAAPQAGGSAEVVAELRALRAETVTLRAQVVDMALHTQRTANATNGQPERPMLVEAV